MNELIGLAVLLVIVLIVFMFIISNSKYSVTPTNIITAFLILIGAYAVTEVVGPRVGKNKCGVRESSSIDNTSKQFADYLLQKFKYILFDFDKTFIKTQSIAVIPSLFPSECLEISNPAFFEYLIAGAPSASTKIIIASNHPRSDVIRKVLRDNFGSAADSVAIVNGNDMTPVVSESSDMPTFKLSSGKKDMLQYIREKYSDMSAANAVFFDDLERNKESCGGESCIFVNVTADARDGAFTADKITAYMQQLEGRAGMVGGAQEMGAQEFEGRWLGYGSDVSGINVDEMREKIKAMGAKQVHENRKYRRYAYNLAGQGEDGEPLKDKDGNPLGAKGFARVREEFAQDDKGGEYAQTTMTVKIYDKSAKFPEEYEISLKEDFDSGKKFLDSLQLKQRAYQETMREKWTIEGCNEIVFDTIPGIPTYVEIDCKSKEYVMELAKKLGLDPEHAHFGSFARTSRELYGMEESVINSKTPLLTFDNADEALGPYVTERKELFAAVVKEQKEKYGSDGAKHHG